MKKLTLRYEEADLELVKEAAWRRGVTTAAWIRGVTLATAKQTIAETQDQPFRRPPRKQK
jgi:uncharacterized protein (DUF1778 family)